MGVGPDENQEVDLFLPVDCPCLPCGVCGDSCLFGGRVLLPLLRLGMGFHPHPGCLGVVPLFWLLQRQVFRSACFLGWLEICFSRLFSRIPNTNRPFSSWGSNVAGFAFFFFPVDVELTALHVVGKRLAIELQSEHQRFRLSF